MQDWDRSLQRHPLSRRGGQGLPRAKQKQHSFSLFPCLGHLIKQEDFSFPLNSLAIRKSQRKKDLFTKVYIVLATNLPVTKNFSSHLHPFPQPTTTILLSHSHFSQH